MFSKIAVRIAGTTLVASLAGVGGLVAASGANAWDVAVWDRVAYCESTGRWNINTGNGYYGGLQFAAGTWRSYGGQTYAPTANQATKEQQIAIARRVLAGQGPGAWPVCSVRAGLTKANGGADRNAMPSAGSAPSTTVPTLSAVPALKATNDPAKLVEDGVLGPLTITKMQKWSGSNPDGIWGPKTSRALQEKVGAQVTGTRDTQTTYKVQALVGATTDGIWGSQTTRSLQKYLNQR